MSSAELVKEYLQNNPWPEHYSSGMKVEFLNNYRVELPAAGLWPLISNTSEVNRLLGLQKLNFEEKNGKLYGSGKLSGYYHEWEEVPWEWETGKEIKFTRIYSKGIISYSRTHYIISDADETSSTLSIYSGFVPSDIKSYLVLKFAKNIFPANFRHLLEYYKSEHDKKLFFNKTEGLEKYAISNVSDAYKINEKKLNPVRDYLIEKGIESSLVYRLINFAISPTNENLNRIKPKVLAETLNVELEKLIPVLLHSCKCGLLDISWDVVCPHCRSVREKHPHLNSIQHNAECKLCDIEFSTHGIDIIEATFSVNEIINKTEHITYCSSEPSNKPHILMQKKLTHGSAYSFVIPDIENKLRFRTRGNKSYGILDITGKAPIKNLYWNDLVSHSVVKCSPGSTVFINNTDKAEESYIIEYTEDDRTALKPFELFNNYVFRKIFREEYISPGNSIEIGIQNIVFIGLAESTEYYKKSGDSKAFRTISRFFTKVGELAEKFRGVIIKTSGDTAMLSFSDSTDALRCSFKLITIFNGTDKDLPLNIRISINRGTCIAVNLDTSIDYFGETVNIASKLLEYSDAGEICLTEDFVTEPGVNRYLKEKNYAFKNINRADIIGAGEILYRIIRIKKLP